MADHQLGLMPILGKGLCMARGEIVALRANRKAEVRGQEPGVAKTEKTEDIGTHRPSSSKKKPSSPLPDRLLQGLACCELRGLARRDSDLLARPGVSAGSGLALSHREGPEACKGYSPSLFQLFGDGVGYQLNCPAGATSSEQSPGRGVDSYPARLSRIFSIFYITS